MSDKLKLLYEYHDANVLIEESVNDKKEKVKKYKIAGIFSTIGEKNRNGRIYPKELWESNVKKYQDVIKSGSINRLCEWEHPERGTVDPMEAVAAINKLEINGKYVMGEATLLDNPRANQLKSLIDNGIKLSVSSRGSGRVKNGIVESFDLITYDLVSAPSDYNATMEGTSIYESQKEFIMVDGKLVESLDSSKVETKDSNTETKDSNTEDSKLKESALKEHFLEFIEILKNKNK
ncbi:peptidase [Campylobacter phage vB_CjeM_WX1]|nr:peptidase [Campylobacter phage vB_CjeM_WX1]